MMLKIGVLALQGNVIEHVKAMQKASEACGIEAQVVQARDAQDLEGLDAIILPGGESTTLSLLLERAGMLGLLKEINAIFGTCAGLILMAKKANGKIEGQKGLELMDVEIDRNAYGSQLDSFESVLSCALLDDEKIMFIRAPKIKSIGAGVNVLAKLPDGGAAIIEQEKEGKYYLGAACHPEMSTCKIHEYFLQKAKEMKKG
ncbi:pyridoxal 5'-phosphate synthase glutaminase subunit PdxT [Candidatus Micrarchaeota archaeon CG10_big_fil_rev_8_21_14_0_10_45_29]|nr:MAG: pyridoxal 5'-phosphate synthase glutaminase subunit PdxT [Candidatus Micrarchaeota archaeon CG10_big_fil_rev_8_21_14_0_10_45_29]